MAMIKIENLYFSYNGSFNLYDINLHIESGEVVTLLGPNGSGKTTLLKCINNIYKPGKGCIHLDGKKLNEFTQPELAKTIGGVPQFHNPTFPYKVIDIVVMGKTPYLNIFSSPSQEDYENAKRILEGLGISWLAERPYTQVSGGERQLIFISRALMQKPKVLLLDEPVTHLDVKNRVKVLRTIRKIAVEKKLTVLMTLHEPNDAIVYSDKIAFMKKGRIINFGYTNTIINQENLQELYDMTFNILKQDNTQVVTY